AIRRAASQGRCGALSARTVGKSGGATSRRRRAGHPTSQRLAESFEVRELDRGRRLSGGEFLAARDRGAERSSRFVRGPKRFDRRRRAQGTERDCCRHIRYGIQRLAIYRSRWPAEDRADMEPERDAGGDGDRPAEYRAGPEDAGQSHKREVATRGT